MALFLYSYIVQAKNSIVGLDQSQKIVVRIVERSTLARLAAKKLGTKQVAMVFNKTIYLHNTSKQQFLANKAWLLHELKHVEQYQQHGFIRFLFLYVVESIKRGYKKNKLEVEAQRSEQDTTLLERYTIE